MRCVIQLAHDGLFPSQRSLRPVQRFIVSVDPALFENSENSHHDRNHTLLASSRSCLSLSSFESCCSSAPKTHALHASLTWFSKFQMACTRRRRPQLLEKRRAAPALSDLAMPRSTDQRWAEAARLGAWSAHLLYTEDRPVGAWSVRLLYNEDHYGGR